MPKYRIQLEQTRTWHLEIEADSWDAASEAANLLETPTTEPDHVNEDIVAIDLVVPQ